MKWIQQSQILALLCLVSSAEAFSPAVQSHTTSRSSTTTRVFFSAATAETVSDGLIKTVSKPGQGVPVQLGDIATVKYSCYLPNEPKMAPFAKANQQKVVCLIDKK
jgi:hypothetical protein